MVFLKRLVDEGPGKPKGSFATSHGDRDRVLHKAWDPITHGNHTNLAKDAEDFCCKYKNNIFKHSEFHVDPITVKDFKDSCFANCKSAAGLDGWTAYDLTFLSDHAFSIIVNMLNLIEDGKMQWPK